MESLTRAIKSQLQRGAIVDVLRRAARSRSPNAYNWVHSPLSDDTNSVTNAHAVGVADRVTYSHYVASVPRHVEGANRELCGILGVGRLGLACEGPSAKAHGGALASILDDCLGWSCFTHSMRSANREGVVVNLNTNFRSFLPLGSQFIVFATVSAQSGRKITARSRIVMLDDAAENARAMEETNSREENFTERLVNAFVRGELEHFITNEDQDPFVAIADGECLFIQLKDHVTGAAGEH